MIGRPAVLEHEQLFVLLLKLAVAASLAIEKKTSVQDVDVKVLQERLLHAGQVLEWKAPARKDK